MPAGPRDTATNPTIFLRLNAVDPRPREMAWEDFSARTAPVISEFAAGSAASRTTSKTSCRMSCSVSFSARLNSCTNRARADSAAT